MSSEPGAGMSLIVKTVTRLTVGLILVYGIYIVLHGHVSPGGGFAGGVVIALSFTHLLLAYGRAETVKRLSDSAASAVESVGALLFLGTALLGLAGGAFFLNVLPKGKPFDLLSAGIIPVCNIAICLKVGAGLFAVIVALVVLKAEKEGGQ